MVFVRFDGSFCCVDSIIVWLTKLPFTGFLLQKFLEWFCCLIVCDVEERLVSLVHQSCKDPLKRLYDGFIRHVWNGLGKDVIRIIVVCNKIVLVYIHGSGRQCPRGICVQCTLLFVSQHGVAKDVAVRYIVGWDCGGSDCI